MSSDELLARVQTLEERLAFQEDAIQKLDDALVSQQRQLMELGREVKLMAERVKEVQSTLPAAPQDGRDDQGERNEQSEQNEKPPHY